MWQNIEKTKEKPNTVHDKKHLVPRNQEIPFFGGNLLYLLYSKYELLVLKEDSANF